MSVRALGQQQAVQLDLFQEHVRERMGGSDIHWGTIGDTDLAMADRLPEPSAMDTVADAQGRVTVLAKHDIPPNPGGTRFGSGSAYTAWPFGENHPNSDRFNAGSLLAKNIPYLPPSPDKAHLNRQHDVMLRVNSGQRGRGIGTKIMQFAAAHADIRPDTLRSEGGHALLLSGAPGLPTLDKNDKPIADQELDRSDSHTYQRVLNPGDPGHSRTPQPTTQPARSRERLPTTQPAR